VSQKGKIIVSERPHRGILNEGKKKRGVLFFFWVERGQKKVSDGGKLEAPRPNTP